VIDLDVSHSSRAHDKTKRDLDRESEDMEEGERREGRPTFCVHKTLGGSCG